MAQLGTFFLHAALTRPRDAQVWRAGALLVCVALPNPGALPYAALVAAAAFAYRAWRGARGSLATAAALAADAALWMRDWRGWGHALPEPAWWSTAALAVALALIAWRMKDRLAGALFAAGVVYGAAPAWERFSPRGELARGIALLSTGFVLFVAGLAVNWCLRRGGAPTSDARPG